MLPPSIVLLVKRYGGHLNPELFIYNSNKHIYGFHIERGVGCGGFVMYQPG